MNRNGVVCSVTTEGRVLIVEDLFGGSIQAEKLSECRNVRYSTINNRVINQIVERRILIDASAERAVDALVHWEVPHFSRHLSYQIQAILARTRKVSVSPWRILKNTFVTVIIDQQALIKGNRGRVLTNRWQAAGPHRERKFSQRRKLEPLFCRVSQNPFDGTCIVIQTNEKILAA